MNRRSRKGVHFLRGTDLRELQQKFEDFTVLAKPYLSHLTQVAGSHG